MDSIQYGFYFDQNRCTGCFACIVACRDWNDLPAGPATWKRLKTIERGDFPNLFVAFLPMTCYHCSNPACIDICPNNAITKRKDNGVVEINRDECEGREVCGLCLELCPYNAPQFGAEENPKMQKCNLCIDRLVGGKKPACVDACPMEALDSGLMTSLRLKYGSCCETDGFEYDKDLAPSIILKQKIDTKNLKLKKILIVPATYR